ncbi:hypothetical protein GCM10011346_47560 [Oceanobacillus neutriphilus]|uniref:Uncharacterized protein n=1 Tax=Oceanobacillus neutriphilus TaxID=531815 RepID=A0ABQ2P248_9BACI|nr:hypothetical protein GCM10011346_47560 [Oceanobacillus neutriphilus]
MWKLVYYRYSIREEYEADSKEDALSFGVYQSEMGELAMYELIDPDGNVVMNHKDLFNYWAKYDF